MMQAILKKMWITSISDQKIIESIESAKKNISDFDINWYDSNNWSLLMNAVSWKRKELVKYLLDDPNININYRSNYGITVLFICDCTHILRLLLEHKNCDVNLQDIGKCTVLYKACFFGKKNKIKELLQDPRVDTSIRNKWGETALDTALEWGYPGIARIIGNSMYTTLLRIPNKILCRDIARMIIEEYLSMKCVDEHEI